MGTNIRAEISEKNQFYISKHRYYELKHFCMQYPMWVKARAGLTGLSASKIGLAAVKAKYSDSDPTEKCVEARERFSKFIKMVDDSISEAIHIFDDSEAAVECFKEPLLHGVTEGVPYDVLKARYSIPCSAKSYYELYRIFFNVLSKKRDA